MLNKTPKLHAINLKKGGGEGCGTVSGFVNDAISPLKPEK